MGSMIERKDIKEFLFPCPLCADESFHFVAEEFAGMTLGTVFSRKPLFATQRANQVICLTCKTVNGQLIDADVRKLTQGWIPKSIHERYARVASFYSLDTLKLLMERKDIDPMTLSKLGDAHRAYRLEL